MIDVILVNYNSSQDTINCIESILRYSDFFNCQFFVFDNASNETEANILKDYVAVHKNVKCEFSIINTGFAYANNFWMKKAEDGDYLWILNNDTLANENLLRKIQENLPCDDEACYMECRTFEGKFHDTGVHFTNLFTGKNSFVKKSQNDFEYICGANIIIKKTEKMPYFDESYFLYYEDCDYGMKLKESNYSYKKIEDCYFSHKIGGSAKGKSQKSHVNLLMLRSQVLFLRRYGKKFPFYVFCKFILLVFVRRNVGMAREFLRFVKTVKKDSSFAVL